MKPEFKTDEKSQEFVVEEGDLERDPAWTPDNRTEISRSRLSQPSKVAMVLMTTLLLAGTIALGVASVRSFEAWKRSSVTKASLVLKHSTCGRVEIDEGQGNVLFIVDSAFSGFIVDSLARKMEIIIPKNSSKCYVLPMRLRTAYVFDGNSTAGPTPYMFKHNIHTFEVWKNSPITDLTLLPGVASKLCRGREVFWIHPVTPQRRDSRSFGTDGSSPATANPNPEDEDEIIEIVLI